MALVAALGWGYLMTAAGGLIAWLSFRGAFGSLQSGRAQRLILGAAWVTFAVSFCLPSVEVFGPVYGWVAAWCALTAPVNAVRAGEIVPGIGLYLAIDIANVLMVGLPVLMWRQGCGAGKWSCATLAVTMVLTWTVSWNASMLSGYYVWCASFCIALMAIPISWKMLGAMIAIQGMTAILYLAEQVGLRQAWWWH
jgi:hypothetical protein